MGGMLVLNQDKINCGELLAKDAKLLTGPSLGRLLNLSDGMLGEGTSIKLLISTNESIGSLNDAVSRPGRCLSKIEFPLFSSSEATKWLADNNINKTVANNCSLAELYNICATQQQINNQKTVSIGFMK